MQACLQVVDWSPDACVAILAQADHVPVCLLLLLQIVIGPGQGFGKFGFETTLLKFGSV